MDQSTTKNSPRQKIAAGSVVIDWLDAAPGPCVGCQAPVGFGPVGFRTKDPEGPLCDGCTLQANQGLGMLLLAINVIRQIAAKTEAAQDLFTVDQQMISLMVVAKMYQKGAHWPIRALSSIEWLEDLQDQVARMVPEAYWPSRI